MRASKRRGRPCRSIDVSWGAALAHLADAAVLRDVVCPLRRLEPIRNVAHKQHDPLLFRHGRLPAVRGEAGAFAAGPQVRKQLVLGGKTLAADLAGERRVRRARLGRCYSTLILPAPALVIIFLLLVFNGTYGLVKLWVECFAFRVNFFDIIFLKTTNYFNFYELNQTFAFSVK